MNDLFGKEDFEQEFEVNEFTLGNVQLKIQEFSFHPYNANQAWPGNKAFAEWLLGNLTKLQELKVLEIGAGCGVLSIFLKVHYN